jgi:enterochelin esterase family protein
MELLGPADHFALMDTFAQSLLTEIVPLVEAAYPVRTDAGSRAIAGLSMGGTQALYIGLEHPDRFSWIGTMSGAFIMFAGGFDAWFSSLDGASRDAVRLVWMSVGTQDFLRGINQEISESLTSNGLPVSYDETPGGHAWGVWRRALARLTPLLFR